MRFKRVLTPVLRNALCPGLVWDRERRAVGIRQIRDASDPQPGFARRLAEQHTTIRSGWCGRIRPGWAALSTLSLLALLRRIDDASIAVSRERRASLSSLTACRRRLACRSALAKSQSNSRDHADGGKPQDSVCH